MLFIALAWFVEVRGTDAPASWAIGTTSAFCDLLFQILVEHFAVVYANVDLLLDERLESA